MSKYRKLAILKMADHLVSTSRR